MLEGDGERHTRGNYRKREERKARGHATVHRMMKLLFAAHMEARHALQTAHGCSQQQHETKTVTTNSADD